MKRNLQINKTIRTFYSFHLCKHASFMHFCSSSEYVWRRPSCFIYMPYNVAVLSLPYACQCPYVHCCIPFLFAFCVLLLHFYALPQMRPYFNPLSNFFSIKNNKRGRGNLFTCHSFSLISIFTFLDYNALNHADIF